MLEEGYEFCDEVVFGVSFVHLKVACEDGERYDVVGGDDDVVAVAELEDEVECVGHGWDVSEERRDVVL